LWSRKRRDERLRIDVELCPLHPGSKIKVQKAVESFADKIRICGNQAECRVLLREIISFPVLLVSILPFLLLLWSREIFFRRVVRFSVRREPGFRSRKRGRMGGGRCRPEVKKLWFVIRGLWTIRDNMALSDGPHNLHDLNEV